jgi:hypothetical protein
MQAAPEQEVLLPARDAQRGAREETAAGAGSNRPAKGSKYNCNRGRKLDRREIPASFVHSNQKKHL